jgi:hypothetical protein
MIPADERISHAMHKLEPEVSDVPDLFERVAANARRRRRVRSGAAAAGAALVVAGIASVPALTSASSTHQAPALANPGAGNASPNQLPTPVAQNSQPTESVKPSSVPVQAAPTPIPKNSAGCPTIGSVAPGPDAVEQAKAAALAGAVNRYGAAGKTAVVTKVYPAAIKQGFGIVADAICGTTLGDNSYVVELGFGGASTPNSASMGSGQLFVADFPGGWQVWFQYH